MRSTGHGTMKGAEARGGGGEAEKGGGVMHMLHTDRSLLASHMITHMHACTHAQR